MIASQHGHTCVVELLLQAGACMNKQAHSGTTALYAACQTGKVDAARLLLNHGSDPNQDSYYNGATPLYMACQQGHLEVARLLHVGGADVNKAYPEKNETPLFVACEMGHVAIVRFLLENGADRNVADSSGMTLKDVARANGHVEIADFL